MINKEIVRKFQSKYGKISYKVISRIIRGRTNASINKELDIPVSSIKTYRGNLTRGAYSPWVVRKSNTYTGKIFK